MYQFMRTRSRGLPMGSTSIFRLALLLAVLSTSECCFKSSGPSDSSPNSSDASDSSGGNSGSTGGANNQPSAPTTQSPGVNRLPCRPEESQTADCHNGGTCYAVANANSQRSVLCACTSDWKGVQCEERNVDIYLGSVQSAGASTAIAVGVTIGVIAILIAASLGVFFFVRKRRKPQKKALPTAASFAQTVNGSSIVHPKTIPTIAETPPNYHYDDSIDNQCNDSRLIYTGPPNVPKTYAYSNGNRHSGAQQNEDRYSNLLRLSANDSMQYSQSSRSSYCPVRQHETSI